MYFNQNATIFQYFFLAFSRLGYFFRAFESFDVTISMKFQIRLLSQTRIFISNKLNANSIENIFGGNKILTKK